MIVYYESQPTGKAELLVANVVSIEVSGGVAAAIAGLEVDFQFDCVGNLLTTHGSFPGHVPGGNLVTVGLRFPHRRVLEPQRLICSGGLRIEDA